MFTPSERILSLKPSGIRSFFALSAGVEGVISLGIGQPNIPTPAKLIEFAAQELKNQNNYYSLNPGTPLLRAKIAEEYNRRFNFDFTSSNVLIGSGACEILFDIFHTFLNPGDEALLPDPTFLVYERQINLAGGKAVFMPSNSDFTIDIEQTKELITSKTKTILLNFPSNPTGAMMTRSELKAIADLAIDHNLIVISDEVYEYTCYDGREHVCVSTLGIEDRTLIVNSFSKSFCVPGWRIGYAVGPEELINPVNTFHSFVTANATTPLQDALASFMGSPEAISFTDSLQSTLQERKDVIVAGLNSLENVHCPPVQGSFYAFADFSSFFGKPMSTSEIATKIFEETKVVLIPGDEFGSAGEGYLRASFGSASVDELKDVISRLKSLQE
ncbi:MAG: aminotransferase class I/II-fold pyridoxal phosphate-dependent enzyme [Candidatus Heimdallarchaeota archaeon]|nr:aminotransferase class I/II-fold pyridoxal phosphate-dependent enzyme [Candidatus Heimdallarchaeota archaeon]MCK5049548.1 aminotransferase class I/II-fold pyridoxal phosphate-dependent enzyme [Candidatus Heimdallarchaeota archaeon]